MSDVGQQAGSADALDARREPLGGGCFIDSLGHGVPALDFAALKRDADEQ
ncbi:MAG: hypothetical protein WKF58_16100 [Ilumatobacteraceae bacterium]